MNYYNEIDPKAAAWLRELIKQNLIPNGIVTAMQSFPKSRQRSSTPTST
jgi:hypothetical protein